MELDQKECLPTRRKGILAHNIIKIQPLEDTLVDRIAKAAVVQGPAVRVLSRLDGRLGQRPIVPALGRLLCGLPTCEIPRENIPGKTQVLYGATSPPA